MTQPEEMHREGTKHTKAEGWHSSRPAPFRNRLSLWERESNK